MDALILSVMSALLGALISFFAARYWHVRSKREVKEKDSIERISTLEGRLDTLLSDAMPLSAAFQRMLVEKLTHFHTPEMDALLVKLGPPSVLTPEDEDRLDVLLEERSRDVDDQIPESERIAASILIGVCRLARTQIEEGDLGRYVALELNGIK